MLSPSCLNVFSHALLAQPPLTLNEQHFIARLMQENRQLEARVSAVRPYIRSLFKEEETDRRQKNLEAIHHFVEDIRSVELHYIKKETILFPYLEKTWQATGCLQLMWSFDDEVRRSLKRLDQLFQAGNPTLSSLNKELGQLFFALMPLIFREERIIFPVASRAIPDKYWPEMQWQGNEIGWCFGVEPLYPEMELGNTGNSTRIIELDTGSLNLEQLTSMLDHLPVDITLVDENDEVRYFSGLNHRIFPRTKAIIGRKVQNCHPKESVHVVEQLLDAFKKGEREKAAFWIQTKGRMVYIQYVALRANNGKYLGTMEITQDVTAIKELKGERRLLDWE